MSTTEILFNSPALHSLKRAQLIQLCKRHNIKAAGKNVELVERLKQHARTLKLDQINSAREEEKRPTADDGDDSIMDELDSDVFDKPQRPSEMWEIVMDDIPEEEGGSSNPGSIKLKDSGSLGVGSEFGGTGGSSKSTVSSSIKAFASSLGLKRSMAVSESGTITSTSSRKALAASNTNGAGQPRDSLLANAIPYASLPSCSSQPLNTEPFAFSYSAHDTSLHLGREGGENADGGGDLSMSSLDRPIPGVGTRSGVEVAGLGATAGAGTIRLITSNLPPQRGSSSATFESPPRLTAMEPTFDLVPPTPGGLNATRWPMTPGKALSPAPWSGFGTISEGAEGIKSIYPSLRNENVSARNDEDEDVDMPGGLATPPQLSPKPSANTALSPPRSDVFVFGTPHAKSKADFNKAASSVLAEMNARLGLVGAGAISEDILTSRQGSSSKMSEEEILNYQFGGSNRTALGEDKTTVTSSIKAKFDKAHEKEFAKMESIKTHYSVKRDMHGKIDGDPGQEQLDPLPTNRKRKSTVLETNQPNLGRGRPSSVIKARRSSNARVISAGTRKKLGMGLPGAFGDDADEDENDATEERQAKRARPSEAPEKRVSIAPSKDETEKERREREAIRRRLDAQKARRRSSKGRLSTGGPRASLANQKRLQKPAATRFGFLTSAAKSLVKSVWNRGAGAPTPSALPVPSKSNVTQASTSSREKPPIPNAKKPSFASIQKPSTSTGQASAMLPARQASETKYLGLQAKLTKSGTVASIASARSNMSTATTKEAGGPRSRSPMPSFEAHEDRKGSVSSKVSSVGTRGSRTSVVSGASGPAPRRVRPSSTLLAPTASSLAKTNVRRPLPVPPVQTSIPPSNASHKEVSPNTASPSKIPVILPLSPRKKSLHAGPTSPTGTSEKKTSIFSTPLVAPTSPGVNPITGQPSPSRIPLAANTSHQNAKIVQRGPSIQRKPRISRSKVIAKLGAQRAASSTYSTTTLTATEGANGGSSAQSSTMAAEGTTQQGPGPVVRNKQRTRSSIGTSGRRIRSSVGGVKASAGIGTRGSGVGLGGASGILMSAKRRARASEYARRRSEKARATPGLQLSGSGDDEGEESMAVDA